MPIIYKVHAYVMQCVMQFPLEKAAQKIHSNMTSWVPAVSGTDKTKTTQKITLFHAVTNISRPNT